MIAEKLGKLGIEEKKAKVYLALLQRGPLPASEIARMTKLKRPTVYDMLEGLMDTGLVSVGFSGSVKVFSAENPDVIVESLKEKLAGAEALMPDLRALYERGPGKPRVKYYEGAEGIKTVCEDILNVKSGEYHYFGSVREMFLVTGREYQNYYVERRVKKGVWSNAIRNREKEVDDDFMRSDDKYLRRVRFFPDRIKEDLPALFIYDDKIAVHSGPGENYAMIIESRELSALMRELWKCVWTVAKD
jgi:sugar-specific transcriptional regulator TrmB